jgi:branched-chain amino acid transport system ATP-binding protein
MEAATTATEGRAAAVQPILEVKNIEVVFNDVILVLRGLSLAARRGGITALLGANGAGKSTLLKAISGLLHIEEGEVHTGRVEFLGKRIDTRDAAAIVRLGIAQVMEGRRVFAHLTAEENLVAGAHTRASRHDVAAGLELVYGYFPRLAERRQVKGGYLSGGEQQMLAIGRALMARPRLLLLDEPSLGLAPLLVEEIFSIIRRLNREEGVTVLLVEQNAVMALELASYGYVMESGRIVLDGPVESLRANEDVKEFYLGLTEVGGRRSYREVKHYRRRKRWLG